MLPQWHLGHQLSGMPQAALPVSASHSLVNKIIKNNINNEKLLHENNNHVNVLDEVLVNV